MPTDLDQLAQDTDHQDRWGMAPTGNGLQDVASRGLPPPQPTPYGIARAQEHQQQRGGYGEGPATAAKQAYGALQGLSDQYGGQPFMTGLPTVAGQVSGAALDRIKSLSNRIAAAMTDEDPYTRAYIAAGLAKDIVMGTYGAAPRGALGSAGGELIIPRQGIQTYHGSPESFDRFDYSKVGTGAGTAYGHGLYVAEHPQIARQYTLKGGYMYETDLRAHPEHFIDLNKPYGYQNEYIKSIMNELGWGSMPNSMNVLVALRQGIGDQKVISDTLLNHGGIKGFKYLDQFSRYKGHGTRNYVVLDDRTINIIKKYGISGLVGLMGAGAYHFQQQDNEQ